ncbi:MAG TPA: glycosyltransferase [Gammaproteobacteria bacterium]
MRLPLNIVVIGLSITSAWGNCHASAYRALIKGLGRDGHKVIFLEWDAPWHRMHRDMPCPEFCEVGIYDSLGTLQGKYGKTICDADVVIIGSYTYEGIQVGRWVLENASGLKVFYDIDTPITLVRLRNGGCGYLSADLIPHYDMYLSATGGPELEKFRVAYGAKRIYSLYCSVDPDLYYPETRDRNYALAYLGNYSPDRQTTLERYLVDSARRYPDRNFAVAGANYPAGVQWPGNVDYMEYLSPKRHREFYAKQQFALNITRPDSVAWGYTPSIRLFEAAACGIPVISDYWVGLETFFKPGVEIMTVQSTIEIIEILDKYTFEECYTIGEMARRRVMENHTCDKRARELVGVLVHVMESRDKNTVLRSQTAGIYGGHSIAINSM